MPPTDYDCACAAWLTGWLAGMRRECLAIRKRERMEYAPRLAKVYDAGYRVGKRG